MGLHNNRLLRSTLPEKSSKICNKQSANTHSPLTMISKKIVFCIHEAFYLFCLIYIIFVRKMTDYFPKIELTSIYLSPSFPEKKDFKT